MLNLQARGHSAEKIKLTQVQLNEALGEVRHPHWTSSTRYNLKSWEAESYGASGVILRETKRFFNESRGGDAERVLARLRPLKAMYVESRADEDGGGVDAVGAIILRLEA
jgi:hypothetical protein